MSTVKISGKISYIKATEDPLSADVGIVDGENCFWVFDVGANEEALNTINGLNKPKIAVISHFHPDHTANLEKLCFDEIYLGANSFKYFKKGKIAEQEFVFNDGIELCVFPLPSSHAKGSLGLQAGEYAFLGDATYATAKQGRVCYNASVLKEEIDVLEKLNVKYFLLSHDETFVKTKDDVLLQLKEIYSKRNPKESYIFL